MPESRAATAICSAPLEWPSRPGLATRNFGGPPAIDFTNSTTSASPADERIAPDTPVGARNSPNTSRISPPHSPVVPPALASAIDGGITLSPCTAARRRSASAASTAAWSRADRHARTSAIISASTAWSTFMIEPSPPSGDSAVSVKALTPTTVWSPDSMRRVRVDIEPTRRDFSVSTASNAPPSSQHVVELRLGRRAQLVRALLDHVRAVEDVVVLEQVGLERQHLLHAQRPLLVPRRRQAERLVPRRELHRTCPGPLRQRHREHLEHDALDVVLRLGLGEPE